MKRLTFSFSVDGGVLGAFLAEHSDNMNIQVFTEEAKPTRGKKQLTNGHAPAALATSGTAASVETMEKLILSLLSEGPTKAEQISHAVNATFKSGRSLMYTVLKDLVSRRQIERPKMGTYALAKLALPSPGGKSRKGKQSGAELILGLMDGGKQVSVADMRKAFADDGRSESSVNDQVGKLTKSKLIASVSRGVYRRTNKPE